tara:strand:+ start:248 stop:469 length:222 start_codon:yes stop_codon:yes gene_type:complete
MKTKINKILSDDDLLKMTLVLMIGIFLGYTLSYRSPTKEKINDEGIALFSEFTYNNTNLALNIPIVRIGSGIR